MKSKTLFLSFRILLFSGYLLFLSDCYSQQQKSQNQEFNKNFFDDKEGLKAALKNIKDGDRYYHVSTVLHTIALEHYLKAQQFNPNNAELNMKIGNCYLNSNLKKKALPYLEKALELYGSGAESELHNYLGQAYHLAMKWDKAIEEFNIYKSFLSSKDDETLKKIDKHIQECLNGKELVKDSVKVIIENMGDSINTEFAEYGPVISADESILLFTSRRAGTTGGGKDIYVNQYFEDIYSATNNNGKWSGAINIGEPVNSRDHDGAIGLSNDGQKLFVYKDDHGDGNIYVSKLKGSKWSQHTKLHKNINSIYRESSASFSPDEKTIYFVSNKREDSQGDRDIFMSKQEKNGEWGKPVNLGSDINTEYGEEGVFMHPDGKTLFFSSQGHNTIGGYDIFMSVFDETSNKFSKPENIGFPINSPDDDVFFVMAASGKKGYYSSFQLDGKGEKDIYQITFIDNIMNKTLALLKGRVIDVKGKSIESKIEVKDKSTGEVIGTFNSNAETGKYLVSLPAGKNYIIDVSAQGYISHSENIDVPVKSDYKEIIKDIVLKPSNAFILGRVVDESGNALGAKIEVIDNTTNKVVATYQTNSKDGNFRIAVPTGKNFAVVITKPGYLFNSINVDIPAEAGYEKDLGDVTLQKVDIGKKMVLNNIFFDFNKANIRTESMAELDRMTKMMKDMTSMQVEISGHTDNVGGVSYNQKLSEQRAKSVVDYLISKGVEKKRLGYKGYGFSQPVATNDTEEGKQLNRRTEFKVLKVDVEAEQIAEANRLKSVISTATYDEKTTDQTVKEEEPGTQPIKQSSLPDQFREADTNGDGHISSNEALGIIDAFFEGTTTFNVQRIMELIDYFFEQ